MSSRAEPDLERQARMNEQAEAFFEPQLAERGLSVAAIYSQNLEQLRASLDRINELIANPNILGTFRLSGSLTILALDPLFEVGALPLLLIRKRLILDRIATLGGQAQAATLRELISNVADVAIRSQLRTEIDNLEQQASDYLSDSRQLEQEAKKEELRLQSLTTTARLEVDIEERRAAIRRRFLEKESVATIVGGCLIVVLTAALIVAMFTATTVPQILSDGFFIILGYFFGQTAGRPAGRNEESPPSGGSPAARAI